jgi:hypothetical protein
MHILFEGFVWFWVQTVIVSINNINQMIVQMEM